MYVYMPRVYIPYVDAFFFSFFFSLPHVEIPSPVPFLSDVRILTSLYILHGAVVWEVGINVSYMSW